MPKDTISNITIFMPSVLTLIGIPGLQSVQCWIGIPFCAMYLIAMVGNSLLLIIIKLERSLHEPMYIFLGMLGITDIALGTSIVPKMLGIFWFHAPEIYFDSCLLQMGLIHTFQGIESGILLAMALDRYVAICYPLRHATIFTHQLVTQIGAAVTLRAVVGKDLSEKQHQGDELPTSIWETWRQVWSVLEPLHTDMEEEEKVKNQNYKILIKLSENKDKEEHSLEAPTIIPKSLYPSLEDGLQKSNHLPPPPITRMKDWGLSKKPPKLKHPVPPATQAPPPSSLF